MNLILFRGNLLREVIGYVSVIISEVHAILKSVKKAHWISKEAN